MAEFWKTSSTLSFGVSVSKHKSKRKFKKSSGKGAILRPCHICFENVNFVPWMEETLVRKRKIWHWANEDGSHHIHFEKSAEISHLKDILGNGH